MKKVLLCVCLGCMAMNLLAQGYRVDFQLNDDWNFTRTDSDKDYYVFQYENLGADDLLNIFYEKWHEVHSLPEYFDFPFINSSFDKSTGILQGTTPLYSLPLWTMALEYEFRLQFRDGKVRINPPSISVYIPNTGRKTPSAWCHMDSGKYEKDKKLFVTQLTNGVINEFLAFTEREEEEWAEPKVIDNFNQKFFTLGNQFKFVFDGDSNSDVFKINGLPKDQIKKLISDYAYKHRLSFSLTDDGVFMKGTQSIQAKGPIATVPFDADFKAYYACEDNKVKVYVPKITTVKYNGKTPHTYGSFLEFLASWSLCQQDGSHSKKKNAIESIDGIEKVFNTLVMGPLQVIYSVMEKVNSHEEEDW